jgi:protein-tyrosine phosphatase
MTTIPKVLIPGTYNSRDLGGAVADGGIVRNRMIIRTDVPTKLGDEGRAVLRSLGVRTAIDLREPVEQRLDPPDFGDLPIEVHKQRIIGDHYKVAHKMTLSAIYRHLLEHRAENLTGAVRLLAQPNAGPALVFCSAGKDRTGLVSALTLGALGVDEDAIIAEYALTEHNMHGEFRAALARRARRAGIGEQEAAVKVGSPPELMIEVQDWIREHHGDAASFLRKNGMTDNELATLRRALVEPRRAKAA